MDDQLKRCISQTGSSKTFTGLQSDGEMNLERIKEIFLWLGHVVRVDYRARLLERRELIFRAQSLIKHKLSFFFLIKNILSAIL